MIVFHEYTSIILACVPFIRVIVSPSFHSFLVFSKARQKKKKKEVNKHVLKKMSVAHTCDHKADLPLIQEAFNSKILGETQIFGLIA